MADTTQQQYRTLAKTTRVIAGLVFAAAVVVLLVRVVLDRSVLPILPAVLLLCVAGAGLLITSGGAKKKADEMEGHA
ncbi:hypothetical protein [Rubrivirga sp. IMCC43871]|uniref:hypothetical protein n=1 Tax=Rubrivirga sp. IMCC43871 TaxID=3391575 RepID=UPI00398FD964